MYGNVEQSRVEIAKALFVETGTYNNMMVRPYEVHLQPHTVDRFQEATQGGMSISPTTLSGVASHFLRPATQSTAFANIDNGWETPRLRFIIEVNYYNFNGEPEMTKIIQGYTSHMGVSNQGNIDPQMTLHFNNVITLRQTFTMGDHGRTLRTSVGEASQLLKGDYQANSMFGGGQPNITHMMRPQDIFTTMGRSNLDDAWGGDVMDLRTTFSDSPLKKSNRKNGSAPHFVSDVLRGYRDVNQFSDNVMDISDMMSQAAGTVKDEDIGGDKFFHQLTTQAATFAEGGSVSMGEMWSLFPEFDHVSKIVLLTGMTRTSQPYETHQAGQTEHWNSANNETIWATILAQSLPSAMMDLMITSITFMATNRTVDGQFFVQVGDVQSFANIDMSIYVDQFITRLKTEVLRGLSDNNLIDFDLNMTVDITGETRLSISIAGGPLIDYAAPSFSDALFAPVLTNDQQHIESVSHNMQELTSNINTQHRHGGGVIQNLQGGTYDSVI